MEGTTIRISLKNMKKLEKLRVHRRETWDEIIERVIQLAEGKK